MGVAFDLAVTAVQGLSRVLLDCAKHTLTDAVSLEASLANLKLPQECTRVIIELYLKYAVLLRDILKELMFRLPHYESLDWRLDVKVASRALHHQMTPSYMLRLETETVSGEHDATFMQCDYYTLNHIEQELQAALRETRTKTFGRVLRYVN